MLKTIRERNVTQTRKYWYILTTIIINMQIKCHKMIYYRGRGSEKPKEGGGGGCKKRGGADHFMKVPIVTMIK